MVQGRKDTSAAPGPPARPAQRTQPGTSASSSRPSSGGARALGERTRTVATTRRVGRAATEAAEPALGRIPVLGVGPVVEGGRWPARAVVGEQVPVTATVFREGHDAVAATAVLVDPEGREHSRARMRSLGPGIDRYGAVVMPDRQGGWSFLVEGWSDPYATWEHDAAVKIAAEVDVELMLEEGARLLERALAGLSGEAGEAGEADDAVESSAAPDAPAGDAGLQGPDADVLRDAVHALRDTSRPAPARLAAGTSAAVHAVLGRTPLRDLVTASAPLPLLVQRDRALFSAWYEMFPRSEGAHYDETAARWVSGTLRSAERRLPAIAAMGFDVVYLPPVHPIGRINR